MGDFAPPTGPPPPKVPPGWKAVWNEQYKEWFFVNLHTKESTWEKPTDPAPVPNSGAPQGAPPGYMGGPGQAAPEKSGFADNNPYGKESDEALARRLQQEENARIQSNKDRGEADSFYGGAPGQQYGQSSSSGNYAVPAQQYGQQSSSANYAAPPPESGSKGLLSKLTSKLTSSSRPPQQYGQYPQHGYPQHGYPQHGYPPQGYGGYGHAPPRKSGGMGALGGAGLGLGAGMLGGAMIGSAMDGGDGGYGGDDGGYGGDDGGDYGGDDGGGGDFGGGD